MLLARRRSVEGLAYKIREVTVKSFLLQAMDSTMVFVVTGVTLRSPYYASGPPHKKSIHPPTVSFNSPSNTVASLCYKATNEVFNE